MIQSRTSACHAQPDDPVGNLISFFCPAIKPCLHTNSCLLGPWVAFYSGTRQSQGPTRRRSQGREPQKLKASNMQYDTPEGVQSALRASKFPFSAIPDPMPSAPHGIQLQLADSGGVSFSQWCQRTNKGHGFGPHGATLTAWREACHQPEEQQLDTGTTYGMSLVGAMLLIGVCMLACLMSLMLLPKSHEKMGRKTEAERRRSRRRASLDKRVFAGVRLHVPERNLVMDTGW